MNDRAGDHLLEPPPPLDFARNVYVLPFTAGSGFPFFPNTPDLADVRDFQISHAPPSTR